MGKALLLRITLCFFISSSLFLPILSAFTPTDAHFLNCGSSSTTVLSSDSPPRNFTPDTSFVDSNSLPLTNPTLSSSSPSLYNAARVFTTSSSYHFSIVSQGTYVLRLHFFPFSTRNYNLFTAIFSVSAFQSILLSDFSVNQSSSPPTIKEFFISLEKDQLVLTFTPTKNLAFVNAIELFNAPPNFNNLSGRTFGNNKIVQFPQRNMETLYRINVGGPLVTPANDTLWRTWLPDDRYFDSEPLALENNTAPENVKYDTDTTEIAPPSVYDTARTMNAPMSMRLGNADFNFNLTWSFPVVLPGDYFVRLHFCDFVSKDVTQLYFDVYLGSWMAYPDLNLGSLTYQMPATAFFLDFAVSADSDVLNISVGRSSRSTQFTANALLNGLEIMKLGSLSSDSGAQTTDKNKVSIPILVGSIVGGLVLISVSIFVFVFVFKRRRTKPAPEPKAASVSWSPFHGAGANSVSHPGKSADGMTPTVTPRANLGLQISFAEIKLATDGFDDKNLIGSGGFGKVYKGVLMDGTKVAVKRGMPGSRQGYPEFQTEIQLLSRIRHRHLVSLIGYCEEQSEMLLVYEYMEKGPLKCHLYGTDLPCPSWKQRLEICIGAARGLHYLHTGYSESIIHRDVKSSNILLGENYVAKVSDFGLSKVGPSFGESHVSTAVKGSFGYFDPEYFKTQKLTEKSDVYSFGVVLFEVLCARPAIDSLLAREQISLAEWALSWHRKGQIEKIIDQRLVGKINANSLRNFANMAEKCLAEHSPNRPTMGEVLWNLEYALQLQETELHREPHEDSGNVGSQITVATVRRAPSTSMSISLEAGSSDGQIDMTTSAVFSQLVTGQGR